MTKVFGYELPEQCRNCEFLNLNTLGVSDSRDHLDPDAVVTVGDHLFTAEQHVASFQRLLDVIGILCPGTANPDRDELQTCGLDILTTPEAD